jgi:hypothetical protein
VALDRNARARFLWLCRMHRAPGRLSAAALHVALALLRILGADGRLDPSHDTLAALARVDVATVKRALVRMRELGLLYWQRRLVRDEGTGWRCEQTSNAYVLTPGAGIPDVYCGAQIARAAKHVLFKKAASEQEVVAPEVRQAAQLVLNTVRQRRMLDLGLA